MITMFRSALFGPFAAIVTIVATTLAGCGAYQSARERLPLPEIDQLNQLNEISDTSVGDRTERYRVCSAGDGDNDAVVACMRAAGFGFVHRGAGARSDECWAAREAGSGRLGPYCFDTVR